MQSLVPITLYGWVLVVGAIFLLFPTRRAILVSYILGWLFLPMAAFHFSGLPPYTKVVATTLLPALFAGVFDTARILQFRPQWFDLPVAIWCIVPMFSSVVNGLGVPDGIQETFNQTVAWGVPYIVGRIYFSDLEGLRELVFWILIGGLIYVPFCLYEVRMSPRLHNIVYGFHQSRSVHDFRFGGYRPKVFMQHGLAVGMWMAMATLLAAWVWQMKSIKHIRQAPMWIVVCVLAVTTILSKSTGAIALLILGIGILLAFRVGQPRLVIVLLLCAPILYIGVRSTSVWSGEELVTAAEIVVPERAGSLGYRFDAEELLVERAWEQPVFGWGGWGRHRARDERGRDMVATDGLWVIAFGQRGLVGLSALVLTILMPLILLLLYVPVKAWQHPAVAPVTGVVVMSGLYMLDCLLNAMVNPIFILAAGGACGCAASFVFKPRSSREMAIASYPRHCGMMQKGASFR